MTLGISKERLIEKLRDLADCRDIKSCEKREYIKTLILDCTELNPWNPIEQAPKDRECLFYYPTMTEGLRKRVTTRVCWDSALHKPTYYQELPPDPKE